MPARYLHPLVCTKCGAALPAEEGQQILVCPYCGQSHAFVPPPLEPGPGKAPSPTSSTASLKFALIGLGVVLAGAIAFTAALAGRSTPAAPATTTKARVTETTTPAVPEPTTHGPGDPKAVYTKGQAVDIHWGSSWWPGEVVAVDGSKYQAHYEGYGSGSDEWVLADRLRPRTYEDASAARRHSPGVADGDPNATYELGEAVEIHWGSSWWAGTIKKKDAARYRVGYDGYGSSSDEWVTSQRLRKRGRH